MPCQTTSVSSRPRIFGFWREQSIECLRHLSRHLANGARSEDMLGSRMIPVRLGGVDSSDAIEAPWVVASSSQAETEACAGACRQVGAEWNHGWAAYDPMPSPHPPTQQTG